MDTDKLTTTSGEDSEMEAEIKEEKEAGFFNREAVYSDQIQIHTMMGSTNMRRSRPKEEKERTKLRERHRRAITARILSGLKTHGNYNLRVRADINDVIAALAREAGWVVLPDGTTFLNSNSNSSNMTTQEGKGVIPSVTPVSTIPSIAPAHSPPLRAISSSSSGSKVCHLKSVHTPPAITSRHAQLSSVISTYPSSEKQVMEANMSIHEHDYACTAYVPVYVMLPLGVIDMKSELVDPEELVKQLRILKFIDVDGVIVNCWWGIVEAHAPQVYNWHGYKRLFRIVKELNLKLQVVMSFHECGGNIGDDVCIPLPHWVADVGRSNPDIYFTDKQRRRNPECLSFGIDKERVLRGRTAIEAYFDFMRSFRIEFDEMFEDEIISQIEIGLGPCGELCYPSNPVKHGWRYPGIGEFQCYDKYLMKSLRKRAETRGHPFWARAPDNAGSYNSQPHETGFFCDGGEYDSYHGRFFLHWYSSVLFDHTDNVLSLAKLVFEGTCITAKIPAVHWWYKTSSHAAELTAGFYNPSNCDGYASIAAVLKKHNVFLKFTRPNSHTLSQQQDVAEAFADPEGLIWQVLNAAWDISLPLASENAFPCYEREGYNRILENAKPENDPDGRHLSHFTYQRLTPLLMEQPNLVEFKRFVKKMHGEAVLELQI